MAERPVSSGRRGLGAERFTVWARGATGRDRGAFVTIGNCGTGETAGDGSFVDPALPGFEVAQEPHVWLRHGVFVGAPRADQDHALVDLRAFRVT